MENDSKVRLLRILELLKTQTDEKHPLTISEIEVALREKWGLDAYRITIQKDIAALIAAGYEIETIRSTQNKYYLASRLFELPELKLLIDAVEIQQVHYGEEKPPINGETHDACQYS